MDENAHSQASDAAIRRVLKAEVAARAAVAQAHREAAHMAEAARRSLAMRSARNEQRIRAVVAAFERDLAERLAAVNAQADTLAQPAALSRDDQQALCAAVRLLARELVEGPV